MDENKMKSELVSYLAGTEGAISPEDIDAGIKRLASSVSDADVATLGLDTEVKKAYRAYQVMTGAGKASPATTQPTTPSTLPAEFSAAQKRAASQTLAAQTERNAITANSSIENYILDRPAPTDYIKEGTMGTINVQSWKNFQDKVEKGDYVICEDDGADVDADKRVASKTNYAKICAAVESGEQLEVYRGDLNMRPLGYEVKVGTPVGESSAVKQMTREQLIQFLVLEAAGYILAQPGKPGAVIKYVEPKDTMDANGVAVRKEGHTALVDKNKAETREAHNYKISRDITDEVVATPCKSVLRIKYYDKNKTKDGVEPRVLTKRVSLSAPLPVLKRNVAYYEVFGKGERESNKDFKEAPSKEALKKIAEAHSKAILAAKREADTTEDGVLAAKLNEKLAAFATTQSAAPAPTL